MRSDYKMNGNLKKLDIEVEESVFAKLQLMEKHTSIPVSELVNTAVKRFITAHKDFLPLPEDK